MKTRILFLFLYCSVGNWACPIAVHGQTYTYNAEKDIQYYMMDKKDIKKLPVGPVGQTYVSSDEKVATIKGNSIKAVAYGDCVIYAVADGRQSVFARVTVDWQVQNPILPYSWEMYVPDTEAHNFDGKIYVYGSLDIEYNGRFCSPYYISLMTPDLKRWESHGYSYTAFDEGNPYPGKILWDSDGNYYNGKYLLYGFYEADYTI
ncbi:Xylosidase/arabinosidase, partial [termite gut metagenome]